MKKQNTIDWLTDCARQGAALPGESLGRMCPGCAFKPGTPANSDPDTMEKAAVCLAWGGTFLCHHEDAQGNPTGPAAHLCAGMLYAKRYFTEKFGADIESAINAQPPAE